MKMVYLNIVCDSITIKKRLAVSLIGYETKKNLLSREFNKIILQEGVTQLKEVTLKPQNRGRDLVEKAINAIQLNYPKIEERHKGFFSEVTNWAKESNKPIYIIEAVIESIKKPYTKRSINGNVKLIEFSKYESELLDSLSSRIYAGSHHIHRFDVVHRREGVLRNPNQYKFAIKDTLWQQGKNIYHVFFEKKGKLSGNLFIQDSSY